MHLYVIGLDASKTAEAIGEMCSKETMSWQRLVICG